MAVLVSQDWQPPKDHTMDALPSQSSPINPSVPRQRSSPANDQLSAQITQLTSLLSRLSRVVHGNNAGFQ